MATLMEELDALLKDQQPVSLVLSKLDAMKLVQVLTMALGHPGLNLETAPPLVAIAVALEPAVYTTPFLRALVDEGWRRVSPAVAAMRTEAQARAAAHCVRNDLN